MRREWSYLYVALCVVMSLACSLSGGKSVTSATPPTFTPAAPTATSTPAAVPSPTVALPTATSAPPPTPIPIPPDADKGYRQWAIGAVASSEYGDDAYSAMQATGKPDTLACGDYASAWSASEANGIEWLELSYDSPTIPTLINIIQTYNPSQIVKVELIDFLAEYHEIYTAQPYARTECPYTLSIPVDVDYQISGVRITVDHSVLGLGPTQIDAVEVIGSVERIFVPEDATSAEVFWRVGSTSPELAELSFSMLVECNCAGTRNVLSLSPSRTGTLQGHGA